MPIEQGDVVKTVARMTDLNGQSIENAYFHKHTAVGDIADATFLTDMEADMSSLYGISQAIQPTSLTPVELVCDVVHFVSGELQHLRPVGSIAWDSWSGGTGTSDGLPQGCAAVVNFPTSSPGVTGRKYLGPLVEAINDDGELNSTALGYLASFIAYFLAGFTIDGHVLYPVLMSTKFSSEVGMIAGIAKSIIGYQRRRKAGRGS